MTSNPRVELLRDGKGIYGFGVIGGDDDSKYNIVTRPDLVKPLAYPSSIAYQMIPARVGGVFSHTFEGKIVKNLHNIILHRAGVPTDRHWGEKTDPVYHQWLKTYHATKRSAHRIVNKLISQALNVVNTDALRVARRYPLAYRANLYHAFCCFGVRAMQIAETFPVAAVLAFTGEWSPGEVSVKQEELKVMILKGKRLNEIAQHLNVPLVIRHVKPMAVCEGLLARSRISDKLLHGYLPRTTQGQRLWLNAVLYIDYCEDFQQWVAQHMSEMGNRRRKAEVMAEIEDLSDWIKSSMLASSTGRCFITRPFCKDMSIQTVKRLSLEWHEAIAQNMSDNNISHFGQPWADESVIDGLAIVPIRDGRELYLEGKHQHNCVNTYYHDILVGQRYIYSVRRGGDRLVTFELMRDGDRPKVGQIRGPCNALASKAIKKSIRRWFRKTKFILPPQEERADDMPVELADDDRIPF